MEPLQDWVRLEQLAVGVVVHEVDELEKREVSECEVLARNEASSARWAEVVGKLETDDTDLSLEFLRIAFLEMDADLVVERIVHAGNHVRSGDLLCIAT